MKILAYILGYLVHWVIYLVAFNLFGESGFLFYLGTFLSSAIGGYLGAIVVGKLQTIRSKGTLYNFFLPLLSFLTFFGGILGVILDGFNVIWEYAVTLLGLFVAFGFFNMYVIKREG